MLVQLKLDSHLLNLQNVAQVTAEAQHEAIAGNKFNSYSPRWTLNYGLLKLDDSANYWLNLLPCLAGEYNERGENMSGSNSSSSYSGSSSSGKYHYFAFPILIRL